MYHGGNKQSFRHSGCYFVWPVRIVIQNIGLTLKKIKKIDESINKQHRECMWLCIYASMCMVCSRQGREQGVC